MTQLSAPSQVETYFLEIIIRIKKPIRSNKLSRQAAGDPPPAILGMTCSEVVSGLRVTKVYVTPVLF